MNDILKDFINFAKEQYGLTVTLKKSVEPDTFEKLFGQDFKTEIDTDIIQFDYNNKSMSICNILTMESRRTNLSDEIYDSSAEEGMRLSLAA